MDDLQRKRLATQSDMDRAWARLAEPEIFALIERLASDGESARLLAESPRGGKVMRMLAYACMAEIRFRYADSLIV